MVPLLLSVPIVPVLEMAVLLLPLTATPVLTTPLLLRLPIVPVLEIPK